MASNLTQRQAQSILLAAKVREYAAWSLVVSCRPCGVERTVLLADLPPDLTVMQTLMRMRCRTCHGQVHAAALDNNTPGWRARGGRCGGRGATGNPAHPD